LDSVRRVVRSRKLWRPGDRLLLGCSGGLDSMVAMALLDELAPSLGHVLVVAHIDHGLREDGHLDADLVESAATHRGLVFDMQALHLAAGADVQGRARTGRYGALATLAEKHRCCRVVTAHNSDDQAETLLMRISRGCGVDALAGIRSHRDDAVVRPLLTIERADLLACARALDIQWREDPSNQTGPYARNRIRHKVLPALDEVQPGAAAAIARTAQNMALYSDSLGHWIRRALADQIVYDRHEDGSLRASLPRTAVPMEFGPLAALFWVLATDLEAPSPSHRAMEQIHAALTSKKGALTTFRLEGIEVSCDAHRLTIVRHDVARVVGADYPFHGGVAPGELVADQQSTDRDDVDRRPTTAQTQRSTVERSQQ
jgi:tRNA(Ile)-lysidine synthase